MTDEKIKERNIVTNRKAFRDYEIIEKREAGIELLGSEVKSLRAGKVNISDSYAALDNGEVFLYNLHISPYAFAGDEGHDPLRVRRLLLHKKEIKRLFGATNEKGFTLIPLRIYFKGPYVKIELATARGRKKFDKREKIAKREADRTIERAHRKKL
ncbi:MAG: SsrA-binding protein [Candidatus Zixiibacteriota bacterium]|nr:MAG: SsrA-binding protein [candidate division Zixibacteria bacterium]HDL02776.1 SsrA-binding protein SmpB [candidate division Zixibacteria bacterium]